MEVIESCVNIRDSLIYLLSLYLGGLILIESLPLRQPTPKYSLHNHFGAAGLRLAGQKV